MPITFPTSLDNFINPTPSTSQQALSHAGQHSDLNDAVEALQAKVGINNSLVKTSIDYKLSAIQDLTNKISILPTLDFIAVPNLPVPAGASFSRASTGTRLNHLGHIVSSAVNEIRHDFDPATGEYLGWLLEPASTNLALYSEQIDNAAWSKTNLTVNANTFISPDGTQNADVIKETTTNGTHSVGHASISLTNGVKVCYSIFFKPDGRDSIELSLYSAGYTNSRRLLFNVTTSSVTAVLGAPPEASGIIPYPNGWFRLWAVYIPTATVNSGFDWGLNNGSTNSYAGNVTLGCGLWGAQAEADFGYPSSYIPTVASSVIRNPDFFSCLTSAFSWYGNREGTLFTEFRRTPGIMAAYQSVASINDGTTGNRLEIRVLNSGASVSTRVIGNGSTLNDTWHDLASGFNKVAASYITGSQLCAANGVAGTPGTNANIPAVKSRIDIGNLFGSSYCLQGWIKRVSYYARALSQNNLNEITK